MTTLHLVPDDIQRSYEVVEWRNATAVLKEAHPGPWSDILTVLRAFRLRRREVAEPGGRKSPIAARLDQHFYTLGWAERQFDIRISVDGDQYETPTHGVDCFKERVALEVEWNNKDPFYDRDLNTFRLLFDRHAIDVGVIITRSDGLQVIFDRLGKGKSYGTSTTHLGRLAPRLHGGGGGGCPILVFGITEKLYVED